MPHKLRRISNRIRKVRKNSTSSWKRGKRLRNLLKKVKIFLFAILTVIVTTAVLYAANTYKLLKAEFSQALEEGITGESVRTSWDGVSPANFFLTGETYGILRVNPELKTYTYIGLPKAFLNSSSNQEEQVQEASKKLGLFFYGYIEMDTEAQSLFSQAVGDYTKGEVFGGNYLAFALSLKENLDSFKDSFKTNISLKELLTLVSVLKQTERAEATTIENEVASKDYLFDSMWEPKITNKPISDEALSAVVLNGTSISGLAGKVTRRLKNAGVFTLDPTNSEQELKDSIIIYKKEGLENSKTVEEIKRTLGIENVLYKESFDSYANYANRADFVVVVGIDKNMAF